MIAFSATTAQCCTKRRFWTYRPMTEKRSIWFITKAGTIVGTSGYWTIVCWNQPTKISRSNRSWRGNTEAPPAAKEAAVVKEEPAKVHQVLRLPNPKFLVPE